MKNKLICSIVGILVSLPSVGSATQVSVFADYLNWKASEETAAYWANKVDGVSPNEWAFAPRNTNFGTSQGVRAGVVVNSESQFWETKAYWTYMPSSTNENYQTELQLIVPNFFSGFLSDNLFFGADMNWDIDMHTFDIQAAHPIAANNNISIKPAVGIKAASIKQTVDIDWDAVIYTATEKVSQDYLAIGPTIGVDAEWKFYKTLKLIGGIQAGFMWGKWDSKDVYKRPEVPSLVEPTSITTKMNDSELGTLMLDYKLGLHWEPLKKPKLIIELAYEMQYWANQLRLLTFQELPEHGDLTFQGVTCGIHLFL